MNLDLHTLSSTIGNSRKEKFFPLLLHLKLSGAPINNIFLESSLRDYSQISNFISWGDGVSYMSVTIITLSSINWEKTCHVCFSEAMAKVHFDKFSDLYQRKGKCFLHNKCVKKNQMCV